MFKIYVTQKMHRTNSSKQASKKSNEIMYQEVLHAYVLYHTTKYVINYLKNLHCWILLITQIILHVFQEKKERNEHNLNNICRFIRFFIK